MSYWDLEHPAISEAMRTGYGPSNYGKHYCVCCGKPIEDYEDLISDTFGDYCRKCYYNEDDEDEEEYDDEEMET